MSFTYDSKPSGVDVIHVQFLTLLLFQLRGENIADFLRDVMVGPFVRQCASDWSHSVRKLAVPTRVTEHKTADIAVEASMATSLAVVTEFTGHEICWCVSGSRAIPDLDLCTLWLIFSRLSRVGCAVFSQEHAARFHGWWAASPGLSISVARGSKQPGS